MSSISPSQAVSPTVVIVPSRVISIDIFRGLTMAVMIFVNALADVHGLPWWTYHAHGDQDLMTYVDMVFPFFLFIVGMSMPLSVEHRLKKNPSLPALWLHVAVRALSLVILGLILANAENVDPNRMGISGSAWALFGLLSAALYLNIYPRWQRFPKLATVLRSVGLVGVIIALALFRRSTPNGHAGWLDVSYPEILGLIGFTYLAAAILYIPTRHWRWAAPAWFILLVALCACLKAGVFALPGHLPIYLWPFDNGAHPCIVMAGIVTSQIFFGLNPTKDKRPAVATAMALAIAFGLVAFTAGWLLVPLGISKIRATPTWALWSIAAAVPIFALLYWICDIRCRLAWASLFRPAGSNTLLTYLLPDFWYFLLNALSITYLDTHFSFGWAGVVKTIAFALFMLILAGVFTRARLRLHL